MTIKKKNIAYASENVSILVFIENYLYSKPDHSFTKYYDSKLQDNWLMRVVVLVIQSHTMMKF